MPIDLEFHCLADGTARCLGNSGVVLVELRGRRNDLSKVYVMPGFVKDDLGATAESILWRTPGQADSLKSRRRVAGRRDAG
ncbi:MAG: hypothetical protein OXI47_06710, partial [Gammaproteobacteria bacterium]|nr:hypothetical protein [Gammaproteobacteria bacterium]